MPYYFINPTVQAGSYFLNPLVANEDLAPSFVGSVTSSNVTTNSFTINFELNENATAYAVIVAQGSAIPTPSQIKAGVDYGAVTVLQALNKLVSGNVADTLAASGLDDQAGQQVTVHIAAEDTQGNLQAQAATRSITVALAATNSPPTVSGNYAQQTVAIGQIISFDASVNFTDTDPLTYSLSNITGATINSTNGIVSWLPDTAGSYTGTVTATDTAGQSASAQLSFNVIDAPAPVAAPYKRVVEWLNVNTPDLVAGDAFIQTLTLKQGYPSENCNIAAAESVKVAIVSYDHGVVYSDVVTQSSGESGAAWINGVVVVNLPESVTEQVEGLVNKLTLGKLEIEVVLNGNAFTWFAPVRLIPGYID